MSTFRCLIALLLLAASAGLARADGLLYNLPKDGTWATYDFTSSAKIPDGDINIKGTVRIASVGQVTAENQTCRWIEVQFDTQIKAGGQQHNDSNTVKVLIPEKYLAKGESPLEHVLRCLGATERQ